MNRNRLYTTVLGLGLATLSLAAQTQTPSDVPQSHWAYSAVEDLASKGMIKGYPPEGKFFGGRSVTRYEMATIIQRILARVDELVAKKADKTDAPAPGRGNGGANAAQIVAVRKLVEDFKTELVVIGTDMTKVKEELSALSDRVSAVKETADSAKATAEKASTDAAAAKAAADDASSRIQSVVDAVKEQATRIDGVKSSKVESGFGSVKFSGLFQVWSLNELDAPNKGQVDTLRLRRAELKFGGNINPQAYWWTMIDPSKNVSLNTTSAGGNITSVTPNQASNVLQELVIGYNLAPNNVMPHYVLEIGQQKVPMSMEGVRSSAKLYTVERALFNSTAVGNNSGRTGDIRETGVMIRYADNGIASNSNNVIGNNNGFKSTGNTPKFEAQAGVFSDGGNQQNATDNNNGKEFIGHFLFRPTHNSLLGFYSEGTQGVNGALNTPRLRLGVEGSITLGRNLFEAEMVRARDSAVSGGTISNNRVLSTGGYLLYAYNVSPKWQLVARGEYWNPNRDNHGAAYADEKDLLLGFQYFLTGVQSKIQFNWIRKNINGSMPGSFGADRNLFLASFQTSLY